MKIPGVSRNRCSMTLIVMAVLVLCLAGGALGSSEGGQEPKRWEDTDTYRVVNFAALAIGLFFLLRKPVSGVLNSRMKEIQDQLGDLEAKKRSAEKELSEYNERLSLLEQEAEKIVSEYIRQGKEARARILKEAESAAEKLEQDARRKIEHEFKQAKMNLQEEIMEKALVRAEEIIKDKITSEDQDRLIDDYLRKVVVS